MQENPPKAPAETDPEGAHPAILFAEGAALIAKAGLHYLSIYSPNDDDESLVQAVSFFENDEAMVHHLAIYAAEDFPEEILQHGKETLLGKLFQIALDAYDHDGETGNGPWDHETVGDIFSDLTKLGRSLADALKRNSEEALRPLKGSLREPF